MKKYNNSEVYPGIDNRFVICDVCGKKFRVRDTVRIKDRWNQLNGMIVCLDDADEINAQITPVRIQEELLVRKDYVRPESTILSYYQPNADTLPSAPRNLTATFEPLNNKIQLMWDGPLEPGNSTILGYRIDRADGMSELFSILESNTQSPASYYLDLTGDPNSEYDYRVSIITDIGDSPFSNTAYYPTYIEPNFATISQDSVSIITMTQTGYQITVQ